MLAATSAADIGSDIVKARKAAGLSQSSLAVKASTTQAMVSQIERGKETAHIGVVLRLIAALGLVVDIRAPGHTAAPEVAKSSTLLPGNVVFDEPLPDESIDIDAIASGKSAKSQR